ncbi:Glutathione S-transferase 3 [Talaromyces pinophilus]|nr:Glutathione S-transferase 3 [Talaromyces pinophilus]
MLTVHHLECSQSERIVWLCEELGIPYNLKRYNRSPLFAPPEMKALTPMGGAPVITDSTFDPSHPLTMGESAAIVEYIIHKHGGGRLVLPPSHKNYSDYLYWFHQSNTNLQGAIFRAMLVGQLKLAPENPVQKAIDAKVKAVLDTLNDRLNQVTWLAGDEFTAADIMTVTSVTTMRLYYSIDLTGYKGILSWLQRVGKRPAYKSAMQKGDPGMVPCLGAAPPDLFPAWAAIVQ